MADQPGQVELAPAPVDYEGQGIGWALNFLDMRDWVHRRVESVTFTDEKTIRRRVSIDFSLNSYMSTYPGLRGDDALLVPLALLEKRPLTNLDVFDSDGRALSLLGTDENGAIAADMLATIASVLVGAAAPESLEGLRPLIDAVIFCPLDAATSTVGAFNEYLEALPNGDPLRDLATNDPFQEVVARLSKSFLFVVVLPVAGPARRVVKFSYEEPVQRTGNRRDRILESFGWRSGRAIVPLPNAPAAKSFHFEAEVPAGLIIREGFFAGSGIDTDGGANTEDLRVAVGLEAGVTRVHLHAPQTRTGDACALIATVPARGGWLRSAFFVCALISGLLFASAWRLPEVTHEQSAATPANVPRPPGSEHPSRHLPDRPSGAVATESSSTPPSTDLAALLMAIAGVLFTVLIRTGEHPLTARHLFGLRMATLGAVGLPFVGAWLLEFGPATGVQSWWYVLAVLSLAPLILVGKASLARPNLVAPAAYTANGNEG